MIITSRNSDLEQENTLSLHALSEDELKIITSLLGSVRLKSSPAANVTLSLLDKIEALRGQSFIDDVYTTVLFDVAIYDSNGLFRGMVPGVNCELEFK